VDRAGIFVDAGYVYAAGGEMCCGTRSRGSIALDVAGFVVMLESLAGADSALPILRTYWYEELGTESLPRRISRLLPWRASSFGWAI
jgi:hypothetical protein